MSSEQPDDLSDRIAKALEAREAKAEAQRRKQASDDVSVSAGAYALRFGIEFVASVFVGGFLGFWLDKFAGTHPWGLLVMGLFGLAAGVRAVIRAYHELNARAQKLSQGPQAPDDGTNDV
ncbi:AtpZ/AtpI family protein [Hyphomonas sp. WL0036]|uniref:AtpZ/AtpI family protein n=1 Tax=Hyphomonas sediminis TaxID=2866160 RepID=UPI001C7ECE4E|nr:AtpZ/AtpI family protein [Hyphomonas sediminis]MBY9067735.1 AtpZ/AtpI family protein [Hyphomonas sediminis]